MKKKTMSFLTAFCLFSVSGIAGAKDQIYYGTGDSGNTGNISGVNWILDKDYQFYGGHQYFYTAYTKDGTVFNNKLTINGGSYTVNGDTLLDSGKYSNYFYGGITGSSGSATGNSIIINNGNFINQSGTQQSAGVYAAKATGKGYVASDNTITVNNGNFQGHTYIAPGLGYDGSDAVKNSVTINGGAFEKGVYLFGGRGYSAGNTDNNVVTVNGGDIGGYRAFIWGGKADNGDARYNTVNLTGGKLASVPSDESVYENKFTEYEQGDAEFYGGYSLKGNALYNNVNINGGSIATSGKGLAYGGYSRAGDANYNNVNVSGGEISGKMTLIGGFSAAGNASGNSVNLRGGSGNGEVYLYGGMTMNSGGNANNNKVAIYFPARLKDICGGVYMTEDDDGNFEYNSGGSGDLITGNELYIVSSGIRANNIKNFETLAFNLKSYQSGSNVLTLEGSESTDLTRANLVLSAAGDAAISCGQTINLISSQGELNYSGQIIGTLKQGVSLNYAYTVKNDSHNLQAVLGDAETTDEAKSPIETRAAQTASLNRGADLLVSDGLIQAESASDKGQWSPFFAMQGGKYRYQTGSHVDSRGFNAILGMAREIKNGKGKLIYGLAGEYGKGSYDSYYKNMRGEGDTDYAGATIFIHRKDNAGIYYEGSFRAGRTKADYSSKNFTGYDGVSIGYKTSANYLGAHLGLGKIIKLTDNNELDASLKYFYSHTGGDSARLTTGETYNFSTVNSHRLRLGAKLTHAFNIESKGYFGAYYERELNGDAKATISGYSAGTPSLKGNRGIFELGWMHQPKNSNFNLNLGLVAACGNQRGVTGKLGMMWKF